MKLTIAEQYCATHTLADTRELFMHPQFDGWTVGPMRTVFAPTP
jgi:hypothetical protein